MEEVKDGEEVAKWKVSRRVSTYLEWLHKILIQVAQSRLLKIIVVLL